jgi:6-phosphofructokinase 1
VRENTIIHSPLVDCVEKTHQIADVIAAQDYEKAMDMRGGSFKEAFSTLRTLVRALPHAPDPNQKRLRLVIVHSGSPSPGMNTAVRAAVRLGLDKGHIMLGAHNGFQGLIDADIEEMNWMGVSGWASKGGAELGTNRKVPEASDFYAIAHNIDRHEIDGLVMIGGWSGYEAIYELLKRRGEFPSFNIPMIALPATINNNLPGSQLSIGADTALNSIVEAIDKIKQSAVATRRCFVVEVMGRYCGYLALMSGLATGAERVYIHEEGVSLADLQIDLAQLKAGFRQDKRLGLLIRNENANPSYSTAFMCSLFEQEAGGMFDVRQAILGHLQQGGDPSPFDRIQATRMATRCVDWLIQQNRSEVGEVSCIGLEKGHLTFTELERLPKLMDERYQRPREQWWLELKQIAKVMAKSGPGD